MLRRYSSRSALVLAAVCVTLPLASLRGAAGSEVGWLRTQQVGNVTYFHVSLETPKDLAREENDPWERRARPRLVPQDGKAQNVYARERPDAAFAGPGPRRRPLVAGDVLPMEKPDAPPRSAVPVEGLEFVGKVSGDGPAKFLLLYPRERRRDRLFQRLGPFGRRSSRPQAEWTEVALTLDFDTAKKVASADLAKKRKERAAQARLQPPAFDKPRGFRVMPPEARVKPAPPPAPVPPDDAPTVPGGFPLQPGGFPLQLEPPGRDDLEGLWAAAQADHLAALADQVTDFGFYSFASEATARKYGVPGRGRQEGVRVPDRFDRFDDEPSMPDRELYETTTGATAIAESLQLRRMLRQSGRDQEPRTVDVANIQGIDIAEHPWESMTAGKKPVAEPLARLTPYDNYYVHFKNIRQFIEFGELLDQWGTNLIRAYEVNSRDYQLRERYEKQLCLKSSWMGKTLGPAIVRSLAITGHDAYLREGSDVTVLFHVNNRKLFLAGVDSFLQDARKEFGGQLKESKGDYQGVTIESYATPLREVSLHRAVFDDFVVYSNSTAAVKRVIDTHQGRHKALADALDFQYMRTIFRLDDAEESGFAFLSDPFIRQLVGPAGKIKEKRRLEALTSLYMLTHGALLTGWETGKLPETHKALLETSGLQADEVYSPEGKPPVWDPVRQRAVSEAYNTLHFATPLVELPIDKVTPREAQEYSQFRLQYLGLWRQYFDPIGMRIALDEKRVKIDTYILPLIQNSSYNQLRRITGDGTLGLDVGGFSPKTLVQLTMHLSPNIGDRRELLGRGVNVWRGPEDGGLLELLAWGLDPVGKWFLVRLDDSPVYARLMSLVEGDAADGEEVARLVFEIPLVVGIDVRNPMTFAAAVAALRMNVMKAVPGALTWEPMEPAYKGVTITRVQATPAGRNLLLPGGRPRQPFLPAVHYAMIDGGFYLALNEAPLKDLIDRFDARRDAKAETVEVNSSLYIAPGAAEKTREMIHKYLEAQTHKQALANAQIWHALYRSGVMKPDAPPEMAQSAANRFFAFIPVSPDGAAYTYESKRDEIVNQRHGSPERPRPQATLDQKSPLAGVLEQFQAIRADLRFREDGVHTVLTIDRKPAEK